MTIDQLLERSRRDLTRLDPQDAARAMREGGCVIDVRSDAQIARDGTVPGALVISRNVLEWRLDPDSDACDPAAPGLDGLPIILCNEGYQSSLVAATLQEMGFTRATDIVGGLQAWRAAGLPVDRPGLAGTD